jgi:leucyl-tRNA synthetase
MAVPAHDSRDFEFATKFELPMTRVVAPAAGLQQGSADDTLPYCEPGFAVCSASTASGLDINGLGTSDAKEQVS